MPYLILHINCDCGSYTTLRAHKGWQIGPKCSFCEKQLGFMQYDIVEKLKARNISDALDEAREKNYRVEY